ncbi:biotin-dependent carboxyltransferase family protein [Lederbergia sp. NSJ-179]|uniref:5-oxoprolinase subunit C family protein n=1 Tax=Lederbergia sp. NSJ-179 TaxID=2931402 RepID=UPI001FD201E5|nr:biotin-dependent carboxyltransferase family protein [Lederbergia sp. NSJ-179]MCJ7842601.1 biotin-dependent carboxyltransferase family protein [Lederbergia sp. NSJ-179]
MTIQVIKAGMQTTIQDLGRHGWQSYGISVCGAMDHWAARLANFVLDNDENEAVIEMAFRGPTLKIQKNLILAIFGADMGAEWNGRRMEIGKPIFVQKGDILTFSYAKDGTRTYLAVKGGFFIEKVLNSYSTDMRTGMGGICGRALKKGDILPVKESSDFHHALWGLPSHARNYIRENIIPIHFIKGRQYDWFTKESLLLFESESFTIEPHSDRMGYRLSGPVLNWKDSQELITEGTAFGSIQVPPKGQPIILMADRQPTGGYPKIGEVMTCDLPRLSQMRPGDRVRFQEISLQEAQQRTQEQQQLLKKIRTACQLKWKD